MANGDGKIGNPDITLDENLTYDLIDIVRAIDFTKMPTSVQRRAKHSFMDAIGVMALGAELPPVRIVRDVVLSPDTTGGARVIGTEHRHASALDAALLNGVAGHVCDFDDSGAGGHVSSIITPTVLALADIADVTGEDLLSAMLAGYETSYRVFGLLTVHHYYLGFHASGTVGTFGAVAAACHLLKLEREEWAYAFGVAGSLGSGLLTNFGSMVKSFHAGSAARNGVVSALLAQKGFQGSTKVLEDDGGFVQTHTTQVNTENVLRPLGAPYAVDDLLYKFNACCWGTHSGADGVRQLMRENGVTADEIDHITVDVPKIQYEVANIPEPKTVWEAKFSVRYTTAAAALGINTAESFAADDSEIVAPDVTAMLHRVEIRPMETVVHGGAADIVMELTNGKRLDISLNSMSSIDDPDEEWSRLAEKFERNATSLCGAAAAAQAVPRFEVFESEPSVRRFLDDLGL